MEKVFVNSITNQNFLDLLAASRVQCCFNIACKYAGNEINLMVDYFMNTAVKRENQSGIKSKWITHVLHLIQN